jgi:hypothetical protein
VPLGAARELCATFRRTVGAQHAELRHGETTSVGLPVTVWMVVSPCRRSVQNERPQPHACVCADAHGLRLAEPNSGRRQSLTFCSRLIVMSHDLARPRGVFEWRVTFGTRIKNAVAQEGRLALFAFFAPTLGRREVQGSPRGFQLLLQPRAKGLALLTQFLGLLTKDTQGLKMGGLIPSSHGSDAPLQRT